MISLGINIDHVATVRNARGEEHPHPYLAAKNSIKYGADSITIHLREDRRHIKDKDLKIISSFKKIPLNLEIAATIKIIKRPNDQRNYVTDQNNSDYIDHEGPIQIEVRGSTSSLFSKKQYALTTYDDAGEKDNVKLLDMPKENDWILSGLAYDTTFVRDFLSYKLSNSIGQLRKRL